MPGPKGDTRRRRTTPDGSRRREQTGYHPLSVGMSRRTSAGLESSRAPEHVAKWAACISTWWVNSAKVLPSDGNVTREVHCVQTPARHAQPGPRDTRVGPSVEGQCISEDPYCRVRCRKPPPWIEAHAAAANPPGQTACNRATGYLGSAT